MKLVPGKVFTAVKYFQMSHAKLPRIFIEQKLALFLTPTCYIELPMKV